MAANRKERKRQNNGKKLIDRITPVNGSKPKREPREGFKTVNGKLVSVNDIGVLLRETSSNLQQQNGRQRKGNNKNRIKNRNRKPSNGREYNGQLVIHTNSDASDKMLIFYNLALGVNQDSLKTVLQKLSHTRIAKVRVRDSPSGSATASVWLVKPNNEELERVRKLFDGALVDGRTIRVTTVSDTQSLSY